MTKNEIDEIRIDITADGENALSMQLCRDGTVGRRGSGQIPTIPVTILGQSDGTWFLQILEEFDERVFSHAGSYDLPDKRGLPVTYRIGFFGGTASEQNLLCAFQFLTGSESEAGGSLLPYFDLFVGKAVELTEGWYQENLASQRSESGA